MNFKNYRLLKEVNESTVLYHRSLEELEPGTILDPADKFTTKGHWLSNNFIEQKLELFRQKFAPDKPSRFNCVYASVIPRSAFLGKGYLYEISPIGPTHTTMAYYIDDMARTASITGSDEERVAPFYDKSQFKSDEEYRNYWDIERPKKIGKEKWYRNQFDLIDEFKRYWDVAWDVDNYEISDVLGENVNEQFVPNFGNRMKADTKWVEVLCSKARVIRKVEETDDFWFKDGDRVKTTKDISMIYYGYDVTGNAKVSDAEYQKIIKVFNGKAVPKFFDASKSDMTLTIPAGTKGTIIKSLTNTSPEQHDYGPTAGNTRYRLLKFQPDGLNFYINIAQEAYETNPKMPLERI